MPSPRHESESVDVAPLAQPLHFEFSGATAKNRFLKSAMAEQLSSWNPMDVDARGVPSEALVKVYQRWGEGEYGMILTGNIMVDPAHMTGRGDAAIPLDAPFSGERFERFTEIAAVGKAHGSLMVAQISHPGRQTAEVLQPHPISASDKQLEGNIMGMTFAKPRAATEGDIDLVKNQFAYAAEYLYRAGFDGIELHGAHGYLISQFLSPTTNLRTDKYGGSLENRSRIILEIAHAIRQRVPSTFVVGIKLNSAEFQDKGFDPEECRELCRKLEANQFDFVELSGGTYEELSYKHRRDSTRKREAFFLEFADVIAPALTRTKTYVTGGFKTTGAMVRSLGTVDGVGLARAACQEFHLPRDMLAGTVSGAIQIAIAEDDYSIGYIAGGTQIRQVGKGHDPIDLSDPKNVEVLMVAMGAWMQAMGKDLEGLMSGYIDLPVGTPYTSGVV